MGVEEISPIPEGEVFEKIGKKLEEAAELDYNEQLLLDHKEVLKKLGYDSKAYESLLKLDIPKEIAVKLADVMPKHEDTVKAVLMSFNVGYDESLVGEILKITKGE